MPLIVSIVDIAAPKNGSRNLRIQFHGIISVGIMFPIVSHKVLKNTIKITYA